MHLSKSTAYWHDHFIDYLEHGIPLSSSLWERAQNNMEVPYVQVTLTAISNRDEINRDFKLDAVNRSMEIGRASSRSSRVDSASENNCHLKSPIVSRRHGRFLIGDRTHPLFLVDDNSTHGTFVNNVKLLQGIKIPLENNTKVTFGNEIIHGTSNYQPTIFRVSFTWHDPIIPDSYPTFRSSAAIRAPTPGSESEDEEDNADVGGQTPYARSPSVVVINSPAYIDLTGDVIGDSENPLENQDATADITNHEAESTESLWKSNNQENNSIVKETIPTSGTTRRSYRFEYADSDPEDESLESASQSSPPARDYDSLYDDSSDDSDILGSPQSHHEEETVLEQDEVQDEEAEYEECEKENQDPNSQNAYDGNDDLENDNTNQIEDVSERPDADIISSADANDVTSYEQSLRWLGAGEHYDAKSIIQLYEAKMNSDPDNELIALECVQVIAENTLDESLALALDHWIHYGNLPEEDMELEIENEDSEKLSASSEPTTYQLEPLVAETCLPSASGLPPISDFDLQTQDDTQPKQLPFYETLHNLTRPKFHLRQPPIVLHGLTIQHELPTSSHSTWHNGSDHEPSPVMRISNIVDSVSTKMSLSTNDSSSAKHKESITFMDSREMPAEQESTTELETFNAIPEVSIKDVFDTYGSELSDSEMVAFEPQKEPEITKRDLKSKSAGQKRKLSETDIEVEHVEDVLLSTSEISKMPADCSSSISNYYEDAQRSSLAFGPCEALNSLRSLDDMEEMARVVSQPQRQKRRIVTESRGRPSLFKTITTHCIAGAIGAIGLVAAIVATTPTQLKEEILYQKI